MSITAREALEKAGKAAIHAQSCYDRDLWEPAAASAQVSLAWSTYAQARQLINAAVGVVTQTS